MTAHTLDWLYTLGVLIVLPALALWLYLRKAFK